MKEEGGGTKHKIISKREINHLQALDDKALKQTTIEFRKIQIRINGSTTNMSLKMNRNIIGVEEGKYRIHHRLQSVREVTITATDGKVAVDMTEIAIEKADNDAHKEDFLLY